MSFTQGASCSRRKALLIAVRNVRGIDVSLPRTHYDAQELKELLISQYGYVEDDIVMLRDDRNLDKSFWPSKVNIFKRIKWLVDDVGEHDKLVFYYSGHGGQTICRHNSEVDGHDEVIYEYNGHKIVDNDLKRHLVDPVLKKKGCQLFALFDCCHSETILDLKHCNCCFRLLSPARSFVASSQSDIDLTQTPSLTGRAIRFSSESIRRPSKHALIISPWSAIGLANRAMWHLYNRAARILKVFLKRTPSAGNEPDGPRVARARPPVSVDTALASQHQRFMSPERTVMSPISIYPNARCKSACDITAEEEDQGRVVCLSACKDNEMAHDDNETGGTLTKFFISSLKKNSGISYRGLLDDIQSQVTDLQKTRVAEMPRQTFGWFSARRRPLEVTSESDDSSIKRKGSAQEPRIASNCPFVCTISLRLRSITQLQKNWNKKFSI